ncbi:glycosyltransferase [Dinghuibacter silviterrae]|uniref:Alpha-1,3-rhamnosyltransferase n=1 Tax=Dinghuibacter silviterrae TaxID=1539049 RepID=A0A4R8DQH7_9BACT|nr:glycosyltransferase [Dinghuibacter silviterrae]TDX00038.1 alpha-1,3-rhamnosyltransferase [Dinghuibacter silviterrae]
MTQEPLVSVIVITYHSLATVGETLDSIYRQTYRRIELIIADDGSSDGTVALAGDWIGQHGSRFERADIVAAPRNGGIPANCNRGLAQARGEYIKIIAGDDVLTDDCIDYNVKHIGQAMLACSDLLCLAGGALRPILPSDRRDLTAFFALPPEQRFRQYIRTPIFLNVPTLFIRKELYDKIGTYDEDIRLLEDQPFLCKAMAAGYIPVYLDHVTVHYRISAHSTMGGQSRAFRLALMESYRRYRKPYLRWTSFPEALIMLEAAVVRFLLQARWYKPTTIDRFKRYSPSRIFLEEGFRAHFFRKIFKTTEPA